MCLNLKKKLKNPVKKFQKIVKKIHGKGFKKYFKSQKSAEIKKTKNYFQKSQFF